MYFFIPLSGHKYSRTNSYNSAMTVIAQDDHLTAGAWATCDKLYAPGGVRTMIALHHGRKTKNKSFASCRGRVNISGNSKIS